MFTAKGIICNLLRCNELGGFDPDWLAFGGITFAGQKVIGV
jgi:hypothetical protein